VTTTVPLTPEHEAMAMAALRQVQQEKEAASEDQTQLKGVQAAITSQAAASGTSQDLAFELQKRGLVVSIVTEGVLFDAGSADLRPEGKAILDQIAAELTKVPNDLAIEGHTDDQPISNSLYPSNWELSTARATNVLRYLTDVHHLDPSRLTASGYGDERPVAPNTPTGRIANRRVDIAVLDLGDSPNSPNTTTTTIHHELKGK
jgi:chemotaxis protein MotB